MTEAEVLSKAGNAKAVLDSPAYADAYKAIRERLLEGLLAVSLQDAATAEDFRRSIKLLDALKGELDAAIQRGKLAQANIAELEARRNNPLRNLFR
jgi:hypothetical protein